MLKRLAMVVLWPAFLMAGILEMLVFAVVDPSNVHRFGGGPLGLSPQAVYSLAFLAFWAVVSAACAMTAVLTRSSTQVNAPDQADESGAR